MVKHLFKLLVISLTVLLFTSLATTPVMAADFRGGETVTIASGEVVDDDLYIGGSTIIIDGTVNGDLWAAGQTITINGTVTGSVVAAGQTITVAGKVDHAARLAGETLNISGTVHGDVFAFGANLTVVSTSKIGGDIILGAGTSRIEGYIGGNIKGGAGEVTITNGVEGDIELEVDKLTITSTAVIKGNLTYTAENEADIQSGAQVAGKTTYEMPEVKEPAKTGFAGNVMGKLIGLLMALLIGIILILIASRRITAMADSIRSNPWGSLGWGAALLFAVPLAAIFVCFTVIGLPLGFIALALWGIALYLSQIPVALFTGQLVIARFKAERSTGILIGALSIGMVILTLLRWIPYLGFWIGLAIVLLGMGTLIVAEKRMRAVTN